MCDCISKIDAERKPEGQCLDATMFGDRKATIMLIRTDKWKHENRRSKPTRVIASFCPFCGEKYDKAQPGDTVSADGADSLCASSLNNPLTSADTGVSGER